jgi:flavin reductase (DIM6/NTAB) family NADH-FMN oxidoreductase RutF
MIQAGDFRYVLGHFASGVTVVTTTDADDRPAGLTASAFTSVSLDPPLILICVDHKSQTYPALLERGRFAINILGVEQSDVSRRFASITLDKFDAITWHMSPFGLPLIDGALAHLECTTANTHVEGDHTIFVGLIEHATATDGEPLMYFRGKYQRLREEGA